MEKDYSYINYLNISEAMSKSNIKFTLLDFNILCLVESFNKSGQNFYMTNDQLAKIMLSCERTIRTSINHLCAAGLLKKQYTKGKKI